MDHQERRELAMALIPVIRKAGVVALDIRAKGFQTRLKLDASPVRLPISNERRSSAKRLAKFAPQSPSSAKKAFSPPKHLQTNSFLFSGRSG